MKITLMSVFPTRAKMVEDVLMRLIDTAACVLMASLGSTVRPTLMNACQHLVFMGGTDFSPSFKTETQQIVLRWLGIMLNCAPRRHRVKTYVICRS